MTGGQLANGIGSALAMFTSGLFILVWSLVGRWWKTPVGRFMVIKAGAIFAAGSLTVVLTVFKFNPNVDVLRYVQAGIWGAVSLAFLHHTRMIWKVNHSKGKK